MAAVPVPTKAVSAWLELELVPVAPQVFYEPAILARCYPGWHMAKSRPMVKIVTA